MKQTFLTLVLPILVFLVLIGYAFYAALPDDDSIVSAAEERAVEETRQDDLSLESSGDDSQESKAASEEQKVVEDDVFSLVLDDIDMLTLLPNSFVKSDITVFTIDSPNYTRAVLSSKRLAKTFKSDVCQITQGVVPGGYIEIFQFEDEMPDSRKIGGHYYKVAASITGIPECYSDSDLYDRFFNDEVLALVDRGLRER